jgi:xylulokinase
MKGGAVDLVLGIDIGTTGCKSVLYDTKGVSRSSGYRDYEILSVLNGWAEEDPHEWWAAVKKSVNEAVQKLSVQKWNLLGICVSCANAIIPLDREGNPLYKGIMQVDKRSQEQTAAASIAYPQEEYLRNTGNYIRTGGFSPSVILWFKESLPAVYRDTFKFLAPSGYIVQKMTGAFTIDYSRASTAALMSIRGFSWSDEICAALKIDKNKLPDLYASEAKVGTLRSEAALELSLPPGVPVCAGLMDSTASMIGAGCSAVGEVNLVIGTVSRLCYPMTDPMFHRQFLNAYYNPELPYVAMAPTNGGGVSFRWFTNTFGDYERSIAESMRKNFYELCDLKAALVPAGCNGLLYLPYLLGERSPMWDPNARGVFFGITQNHTKPFFLRSIMEGVGHATLQNLQLMERDFHCEVGEIVITGGGAKSLLWCEIMANMLNKRIIRLEHSECETRGAAFVAGIMAGVYQSYGEIKKYIAVEGILRPDASTAEIYLPMNEIFQSLYAHLKDDFHALARINQTIKKENFISY